MSVRYNKVSLYQGCFPYILLSVGLRKLFVILTTSGLLNQGSTVIFVSS